MKKIMTPHDRYYRATMSDPRVAREFFEQYLPDNIRAIVNLDTLKLRKESIVDSSLQLSITDMLFSAEFAGESGYLYFLSEHQTKPDRLLPFWLLKYIIAIMDQHITATSSKNLPIVYPLIYYGGRVSYPYSTDIFDLFGNDQELAKTIFLQPFQLIDLKAISDESLREQTWCGVMGFVMKHIYERDILPYLKDIIELLHRVEKLEGKSYIEATLTYLMNTSRISNRQTFIETIYRDLSQETGEIIMTLAEQWKLEGKMEGEMKGKREVALNLLRKGMSPEDVVEVTRLPRDEIKSLKKERV